MINDEGVKWKKAYYQWSGVTNPNRAWWQFWKPPKANILLTFHYYICEAEQRLKLGNINLEIEYE